MELEEIEAHIEIRQVLNRYCRGVDRGDRQMLKDVYHADAIDDHGTWTGPGRDFADHIVDSLDAQGAPSQHHITNVLIELDGAHAAVESYFIAFHPHGEPGSASALAFVGGRYLDRFERRDGRWRIAHRQVVLDWTRETLPGPAWELQGRFARGQRHRSDASADLFRQPAPGDPNNL
jgi:hypothetical protein